MISLSANNTFCFFLIFANDNKTFNTLWKSVRHRGTPCNNCKKHDNKSSNMFTEDLERATPGVKISTNTGEQQPQTSEKVKEQLFSVDCWTFHTSAFHHRSDPVSSLWLHHCKMACITAPFQTIRHSCYHLSLKGHCRIWGRQTSRGFLTEGPGRWIKWAEMPWKHLTYMKVSSGCMHYRALSRPVKTTRDPQQTQLLFLL